MTTFFVQVDSMHTGGLINVLKEFAHEHDAYNSFLEYTQLYGLENKEKTDNGYEAGGIGYDSRAIMWSEID